MRNLLVLFTLFTAHCVLCTSAMAESQWIWSPRTKDDASGKPVFFRKTFEIDEPDKTKGSSRVEIAADNTYILLVNGKRVGAGDNWNQGTIYDITGLLVKGSNLIAVETASPDAMAGLVATVSIKTKDGKTHDFSTDKSWLCTLTPSRKWEQPGYDDKKDDKKWEASHEFGPLNKTQPWGANTKFSDKPATGNWNPQITPSIENTFIAQAPHGPWKFDLKDGDRVVFLGATFIEREGQWGYLEAALTARYPDRNITFRNLGWSGDTVWGEARARFGDQREGFNHLTRFLRGASPTVILVAYGHNESYEGEAGLARFDEGMKKLLPVLEETGARIAFISPHQLENKGAPLPNHAKQNENIYLYTDAIAKITAQKGYPFFNLFTMPPCKACEVLPGATGDGDGPAMGQSKSLDLTYNGIHLNDVGYWQVAQTLLAQIGEHQAWRARIDGAGKTKEAQGVKIENVKKSDTTASFTATDSTLPVSLAGKLPHPQRMLALEGMKAGKYELRIDGKAVAQGTAGAQGLLWLAPTAGPSYDQASQLRELINKKNELFFHYWRPANETYIYLFRKHEQGNNAVEMPQFIPLVEAEEKKIAELRVPKAHQYEVVAVQ